MNAAIYLTRRASIPAALLLAAAMPSSTPAQDQRSARVDSIFASFAVPGSPGCAVGAIKDGRLVHGRGYGLANLDYDVPIDTRSVFYLASVSKQVTAFALALAAQEGKLSLDDDVRKYMPELPDYGTPVTIRHLVHHTSGVRDYLTLIPLSGRHADDAWTDAAFLDLIARQKALNFTPGTEYLYSNTGYVLLAEIVKRATGKSLRAYADERIFQPLGMRDTHFHDDAGVIVPRRVIGYVRGPAGWRMNHWFSFDKVGDGGLYSTIEDLAKWDANFYSGVVGGSALREQVVQRGVLTKGDTIPYAFGLNVSSYRGLRILDHGGSLTGFRTGLMRFPDQRFTAVVLCNTPTANTGQLARRVADVYLRDRMTAATTGGGPGGPPQQQAAQSATVSAAEGRDFVGSYHSEELDATYEFIVADSQLVMRRNGDPVPVRRSSGDVLRGGNLTLRFTRDPSGRVTGFALDAGRVRGIRFERLR
jgi:CubicO group peptidase (beta-lactamase class C family)